MGASFEAVYPGWGFFDDLIWIVYREPIFVRSWRPTVGFRTSLRCKTVSLISVLLDSVAGKYEIMPLPVRLLNTSTALP